MGLERIELHLLNANDQSPLDQPSNLYSQDDLRQGIACSGSVSMHALTQDQLQRPSTFVDTSFADLGTVLGRLGSNLQPVDHSSDSICQPF